MLYEYESAVTINASFLYRGAESGVLGLSNYASISGALTCRSNRRHTALTNGPQGNSPDLQAVDPATTAVGWRVQMMRASGEPVKLFLLEYEIFASQISEP